MNNISSKTTINETTKIAVVTGGAQGIGKTICQAFAEQGVVVCCIDMQDNDYFVGDIAEQNTLDAFADKVIADYGRVDYLINNASLSKGGLMNCSYDDFNYVLRVGVSAPFYLTQRFLPVFTQGASVVNISSTRQLMSQANTESYSAAKGGISALTHAMALSLAGKVRVNSISPGWIDTTDTEFTGADAIQHPAGRVGKPEDIANAVLFLCDEKNSFINAQDLVIDGGMSKQMIYHDDRGWHYQINQRD